LFEIIVRSKVTGQTITVQWGDGLANTYVLSSTVDTTVGHTYATAAIRIIKIIGGPNIKRLVSVQTDGRSNWGAVITGWTGLTYLSVWGSNTVSGSVAALTGLTYLIVGGSNTVSGSIAALTGLTLLSVWGSNTVSGSVAALTSLTSLNVGGSNTVSGSIAALTGLTYLEVLGSNTLSGSVAALIGLTYLRVTGGLNTITWAVGPLTLLQTLNCSDNALNQATVDSILSAMYTARMGYTYATPTANLAGTNADPSGIYQNATPPLTGMEFKYKLVLDPDVEGFRKWAITT
jgi:hypothetical protein